MWLIIRICDGEVDELDAYLAQPGDVLSRLLQIWREGSVLRHGKAIRIGHHVTGIQAGRHEHIRTFRAHLRHRLAHQARAVLQRATITPLAQMRSLQLRHQITVAPLDVNTVKARLLRQFRRMDVCVLKTIQVVVGHQRVVGWQLMDGVEIFAMVRNDGRWHALGAAVAPRVGQLQDADGRIAILLQRGLARLFHQVRENLPVAVVYPHLRRIRARLVQHGARLEPNQAVLPMRIAEIAPEGQFAWRAVRGRIEPLHRMHREAVGNRRDTLYLQRLLQDTEVVLKENLLPQTKGCNVCLQIFKAAVIESLLLCHSSLFVCG